MRKVFLPFVDVGMDYFMHFHRNLFGMIRRTVNSYFK